MRRTSCFATSAAVLAAVLFLSCVYRPIPPAAADATDVDVVVIGAGMGGLSAAAHLASAGLKVVVLEQHHKVGGCTSSFSRGGFNFDVALHEMAGGGPGSDLGRLLAACGVAPKIDLIRIPDLYRSILPGVDFTMPADMDAAVRALSARWPDERRGIARFHGLMKKLRADAVEISGMYRKGLAGQLGMLLAAPLREPTLLRYLTSPLQPVLDDHFHDPALKAVISQLWVYYGPPPSRLWAPIFMLANHTYLTEGAYQIKGSSQALSDAYAARIAELGGTVRTGTRAAKILVTDGRATGVVTDRGETITARYVVSNADPFQTFFSLVGEDKTPPKTAKRIRAMKPGVSLVGVYLGLDVPPSHWNCANHEMFVSTSLDADESYRAMIEGRYDQGAAAVTFYTNLGDPFYAPPGKSVLVLHAYSDIARWPKDRAGYEARKAEAGDQLITLAERVFPGLRAHIVVREMITPVSLAAFTLQHDGIPYGWDFTVRQGMRLPNPTAIDGLYLAGSWTNPGHGVGTAQISGYQAARLILDREGRP
jgi:prolycopene isomerase